MLRSSLRLTTMLLLCHLFWGSPIALSSAKEGFVILPTYRSTEFLSSRTNAVPTNLEEISFSDIDINSSGEKIINKLVQNQLGQLRNTPPPLSLAQENHPNTKLRSEQNKPPVSPRSLSAHCQRYHNHNDPTSSQHQERDFLPKHRSNDIREQVRKGNFSDSEEESDDTAQPQDEEDPLDTSDLLKVRFQSSQSSRVPKNTKTKEPNPQVNNQTLPSPGIENNRKPKHTKLQPSSPNQAYTATAGGSGSGAAAYWPLWLICSLLALGGIYLVLQQKVTALWTA